MGLTLVFGAAMLALIAAAAFVVYVVVGVGHVVDQLHVGETKCTAGQHQEFHPVPVGKTVVLVPYCADGVK